jgi:hypothetical protein
LHFKDFIVKKEKKYLDSGGKLIFKYGSTVIASMGANGIFISANNVIAGGTP